MPARKPLRQSGAGFSGQPIRPLDRADLIAAGGPDGRHPAGCVAGRSGAKVSRGAADAQVGQVSSGPGHRLRMGSGQPEQVSAVTAGVAGGGGVMPDGPGAADHPAQVATPVSGGVLGRLGEAADSRQCVTRGQERPPRLAAAAAGHMLPAVLGQEPMITAGHELGAVIQHDPVGRLNRGPVRQHRGDRVPAADAAPGRAVDLVASSTASCLVRPSAIRIGVSPERQ